MRRRLVIGHVLWRRVSSKFLAEEIAYRRRLANRPIVRTKRRAGGGERGPAQRKRETVRHKRSRMAVEVENGVEWESSVTRKKARVEDKRAEGIGGREGAPAMVQSEGSSGAGEEEEFEMRGKDLFKTGQDCCERSKGRVRNAKVVTRAKRCVRESADCGINERMREQVKAVAEDAKHGVIGGKMRGRAEGVGGPLGVDRGKNKRGRREGEGAEARSSLKKQGLKGGGASDPAENGGPAKKTGRSHTGFDRLGVDGDDNELDAIFAVASKGRKKQEKGERKRKVGGENGWAGNQSVVVAGSKDDLFGVAGGDGGRKRTEEGYRVFREEELGLAGGGGDTPLCPFDCDCCF